MNVQKKERKNTSLQNCLKQTILHLEGNFNHKIAFVIIIIASVLNMAKDLWTNDDGNITLVCTFKG